MMASAPAATATRAFSSSLSMLVSSRLVPMLALTLVRIPLPTARGTPFLRRMLWQMMAVPAAIPWRRVSGSIPSISAARRIRSVTVPARASSSWVMKGYLFTMDGSRRSGGQGLRRFSDWAGAGGP